MYSKNLITLLAIFLVTVNMKVDGTCLEYGHSCWGAHGKRSGGNNEFNFDNDEASLTSNKDNTNHINELQATSMNGDKSATYQRSNEDMKPDQQMVNKIKELFDKHSKKMQTTKQLLNEPVEKQDFKRMRQNFRWRKLPMFKLAEMQNQDNDLLQQLERRALPNRVYDDFAYYDGQ